jgi:hypothetical protein
MARPRAAITRVSWGVGDDPRGDVASRYIGRARPRAINPPKMPRGDVIYRPERRPMQL